MAMSSTRWNTITPSNYGWERDALDFVREGLPDHEPYRAWSNFEFISDDGTINEVDLLVLTPQGFFLVEIKSKPGVLSGDSATWVWANEGKIHTEDNPIVLANRKAKKLAALLKRQKACSKIRFPYLEPLIFCSHPEVQLQMHGVARYWISLRDRSATADRPARKGIISALKNRDYDGAKENVQVQIDRPVAKAITIAMEQAGIRQSQKSRRVGDYVLGKLLYDSPTGTYQDWEATHSSIETAKRRVRIYNLARNSTEAERETIRKAARREFQLIEGISHSGILSVENFTEHELGPALIYRHDPDALRLDHYLAQYADRLNVDIRLNLLRQIAEAVKYAHEKRIVHRALSPQSVLVSAPDSQSPKIQIFNWQTGYRVAGTSTTSAPKLTATFHPEQLVEDVSTVYMAPEGVTSPESMGEHLDVFSLGAIAYHIFSGQPPAAHAIELAQKIKEGKGLQISSVMDGAGRELQELIQFSTHPEVFSRLDSAGDFLELLDQVENELTTPDEDVVENPLEARVGDRLAGGFVVRSRLGSGSSAVAMLVERDGKELVLKLASQPEHNDRLRGEAETVKKLRHQNIVEAYDVVEIGGLVGFTMQKAGDKTLAQRLRAEGRLHLELLERFGEDLLEAVRHLEEVGVQHRDIKPDNIGIRPLGRGDKLRLVLFDFSLSRTPLDNIRAGTPPYLDPFLSERKPQKWDSQAERFAVAMTLYEMATGTLPRWGDGQSRPDVLDCEATLDSEYFDPNLRERMLEFFSKALRRDARERFDNAEEMLREWRRIFEALDQPASLADLKSDAERQAAIEQATLSTQLVSLGLSTRAINAFDRMNVITVGDLLRFPLRRIYRLRGVGSLTRREIAAVVNDLRRRFPDVEQEPQTFTDTGTSTESGDSFETQVASVDLIAQQIAKYGTRSSGHAERKILHTFIGWDVTGKPSVPEWLSQTDVAKLHNLTRARVGQVVTKARERWLKNPSVTSLRQTIADLLEANGGAMSTDEMVESVLAARGSSEDEPLRSQFAFVVVRAALEAERASKAPRFIDRRHGAKVLVASDAEMADYAERLGRAADKLAELDPIPTPARTVETLRDVSTYENAPPLTDTRLVNLAVAASSKAALSSRMEIYPKGMSSLRALKLAHGALFGARELTVEEIQQRVEGRYPEAERLPGRPELDQLLAGLELDLKWVPEAANGRGAYRYQYRESESDLTSSTFHVRYETHLAGVTSTVEVSTDVVDARIFENKLRRADDEGGFLALTVPPRTLLKAEEELLRRFDVVRCNVDELFIKVMREQAATARVDWRVVLKADAAPQDSQDWRNLMILVGRCAPIVEEKLSKSDKTLLLVYPGLLARYGCLDILERLRDKVGTPGSSLHGLWVLLASDEQSPLPTLNGQPVPVISSGQWARIPEAWISNAHRSNGQVLKQSN